MGCHATFKPRWPGDTTRPCNLPVEYHVARTSDLGTTEREYCRSHMVDVLHDLLDIAPNSEVQVTVRRVAGHEAH